MCAPKKGAKREKTPQKTPKGVWTAVSPLNHGKPQATARRDFREFFFEKAKTTFFAFSPYAKAQAGKVKPRHFDNGVPLKMPRRGKPLAQSRQQAANAGVVLKITEFSFVSSKENLWTFLLAKTKITLFVFALNLPEGSCGKSECGDFDNKRAVTDRRREKTGGQPAERASPRVFSETQANRSISFARFARSFYFILREAKPRFCLSAPDLP